MARTLLKSSKSGLFAANSNPGLTIRTIRVGKADITWNKGVVRLKYFSSCIITSFDVYEDMSL